MSVHFCSLSDVDPSSHGCLVWLLISTTAWHIPVIISVAVLPAFTGFLCQWVGYIQATLSLLTTGVIDPIFELKNQYNKKRIMGG